MMLCLIKNNDDDNDDDGDNNNNNNNNTRFRAMSSQWKPNSGNSQNAYAKCRVIHTEL